MFTLVLDTYSWKNSLSSQLKVVQLSSNWMIDAGIKYSCAQPFSNSWDNSSLEISLISAGTTNTWRKKLLPCSTKPLSWHTDLIEWNITLLMTSVPLFPTGPPLPFMEKWHLHVFLEHIMEPAVLPQFLQSVNGKMDILAIHEWVRIWHPHAAFI